MSAAWFDYFKKAGVVAAAVLAVLALINTVNGIALRLVVLPAIHDVMAEERAAREKADDKLTDALGQLSKDRIDLMTIMETPAGPQRAAEIRRVKTAWTNSGGKDGRNSELPGTP